MVSVKNNCLTPLFIKFLHKSMKTLGIIPARYASTRFPGKPLVKIQGIPMIQHVYQRAKQTSSLQKVVVATDDKRILQAVQDFGGEAMMTNKNHQSGTDRCAEVAKKFTDYDAIVNLQGDEPFIHPEQIDAVVHTLQINDSAKISTLAKQIEQREHLLSPNIVKVVFNQYQRALYFSRNAIPFLRDTAVGNWLKQGVFYKHLGIYAFKRNSLLEISQLPIGQLENFEKLEQLRWLEAGYDIQVGLTDLETIGIDTPADLERLSI